MLDEFGAGHRRDQERRRRDRRTHGRVDWTRKSTFEDGAVNFAQLPFRLWITHTDYKPIRVKKISNGGAFTQELRIGGHTKETAISTVYIQGAAQLFAGLCRNC